MEKDKEIDMLQIEIQQLINRCIILNKDEMTATARMVLGRDIELRFRKILQENEYLKLKEKNKILGRYGEIEVHELINRTLAKDYISKDKIKEQLEELDEELKNCRIGINCTQEDYYIILERYEFAKEKIQELLEGDE